MLCRRAVLGRSSSQMFASRGGGAVVAGRSWAKSSVKYSLSTQAARRPTAGTTTRRTTTRSTSTTTTTTTTMDNILSPCDTFARRHIGPTETEQTEMLTYLGYNSMSDFIEAVVPPSIRTTNALSTGKAMTETQLLEKLRTFAKDNSILRSHIGLGYHGTIVPPVIQRNVLESPAWYTPYTPYQAEISQGRLESLLNFQTGIIELTGMQVANGSLLDEATAAGEALSMCLRISKGKKRTFLMSENVHPQCFSVLQSRAQGLNVKLQMIKEEEILSTDLSDVCGVYVMYPDTFGTLNDYSKLSEHIHQHKSLFVVGADLLGLALLTPPGEFGADIVLGSAQRFGVPLGYGGPHAAYFATHDRYKRDMPGRIIGVSRDSSGKTALRMALQTREQHIRREKATSNVCTAQALLANISAFYMLYHGPEGLRRIATRTHTLAKLTAKHLEAATNCSVKNHVFFDTVHVQVDSADDVLARAVVAGFNLRKVNDTEITIAFDETNTVDHVNEIVRVVGGVDPKLTEQSSLEDVPSLPDFFLRKTPCISHPKFRQYSSETDMLRYIYKLQSNDLGLQHAMIPLGSCTMKLNATTEMMPVTWPEFANIHPFVPADQATGYYRMFEELEKQLAEITGFDAVSLQPNSGAQGEFAGLMAIAAYHKSQGNPHRKVCLIPISAHGTNPASAVLAGMEVRVVRCDEKGNVDREDLKEKAEKYSDSLAALMITYPSTHGVFEEGIKEITAIIHDNGGMVYMDGANMNAQVGLCRPGEMGADVCHLNLHKTFCIPHGGGGPGMGPIGVTSRLAPFLPSHPHLSDSNNNTAVSGAPFGSSLILPISWSYINLMGSDGLTDATKVAILNANYMAARLNKGFKVLYTAENGTVAHEFILDLRPFKATIDVSETDVAKRLLDYSFHAPTMSWPVSGTLMVEPTESESKAEIDRFCDAMLQIREEIKEVETGQYGRANNVLKGAPHSLSRACFDLWQKPYPREKAVFPVAGLREPGAKFWPVVGRLDDALGDREFVCSCPPLDQYLNDE